MGLSAVFVVLLVLGYRRHSRVSRDRTNLRISRDRANFDLQIMSHQVQVRVQIQSDDSASLPDSLRSKRSTSLRKAQATSLPPGPPSSSNDQSVVEQEEEPALSAPPATWHANRFGAAANSGEEPMASAPATAAPTGGLISLLRRASFAAPPKRPAPPEPAYAPRAKRAVTLNAPPAMLPPGAPPASASSIAPPPARLQSLAEGESAQSRGSALTAPALGLEEDFEPTEAELAAFLEDEEVMLEIQALPDLLGCPPARASPAMVADVSVTRQHVAAHEAVRGVPEILGSTPAREDGGGSEREELHLADHGQVGTTRGQQALYMARQHMQISRTDAEIHQVVHTLALALGVNWPQAGTHKALLAVLILLDHPELSEHEICASTGASSRSFRRWKSKVLKLGPLPPH